MNDKLIYELLKQAEQEDEPAELRRLGNRLQSLGQYDFAAFCFNKAARVEREQAESVMR